MNFIPNSLQRDEFGRVHGIVAVNKPAGMTSHDVVDVARRALGTKKVGHAGALDPFATGLLVLVVGKATKLSDEFLGADKEYIAKILFGVKTDSADTEGKILEVKETKEIDGLEATLQTFIPEYTQYVPVFSSVKVDGEKLRVLARKYETHTLEDRKDGRYAIFKREHDTKEVKLPAHLCQIPEIELISQDQVDGSTLALDTAQDELEGKTFISADIRVSCSKGTYIRTLAEDIGLALSTPLPAMLIELQRTRVGDIRLEDAVKPDDLANL